MKIEHIIHFKVIRKGETKQLRGLIYLEENQLPTLQDYEQCLKQCGHDVRVEDTEKFIFKAFDHGEEYLIDVLEDHQKMTRDRQVENLASNFIKKDPLL
ncbi:hypothetical protein [Paenibacillus sp. y28]|uniref:hypothetical protein n=1 Tax=Paenibacillus sp. y28 TaxID=3129110 RepID=UPI0030163320